MKTFIISVLVLGIAGVARAEVECYSYQDQLEVKIQDTFLGRVAQLNEEDFEVILSEDENTVSYISQEKLMKLSIDLKAVEKSFPPTHLGSLYHRGLKSNVRCFFE